MINPGIFSFSSLEWIGMGWTTIGIPLANHLWQSTLFAAVAGLVTLALRKNRAQVRYWLWLAASVKFLIPFSLLVGMGSHLSLPKAPALAQPELVFVAQEIGQPFAAATPPTLPSVDAAVPVVPILLVITWMIGCAGILLLWCLRWRRLTTPLRSGSSLARGRELEAQRRMQRSA